MAFKISSPSFANYGEIPRKYTADGQNYSPPLRWQDVPETAKELVLICDDPDAATAAPWVHWLAYDIDPSINGVPEHLQAEPSLDNPVHLNQGRNTSKQIGYVGPLPPRGSGWHSYIFRLFALASPLKLAPGATKEEIWEAMKGGIVATTSLVGKYRRL